MNQDPRVKASVMFGRGRFNTGILIEPAEPYTFDPEDTDALVKFRNDIWCVVNPVRASIIPSQLDHMPRPTVERMNKYAPQHSRLFKEVCHACLWRRNLHIKPCFADDNGHQT